MERKLAVMKPGQARRLSEGEIAIARGVFADEARWDAVTLVQALPLGFGAVAPMRHTIFFANWRAPYDFTDATLVARGWFVHEFTHVWQAARGVVLPVAKLKALGRKAYAYAPKPEAKLGAYNIEQQAEIVRHLYLAREGVPDTPPLAWLEAIWAKR